MSKKKALLVGAAASAFLTASAVTAWTAPASARNGVCEAGEFCLYYNSNQQGAVSDFAGSLADYGTTQPTCYEFRGKGAGKGLCVKNHAASVRNKTSAPVTIYFNSGFAGASQTIPAGSSANLNATLKNQNASHKFASRGGGKHPDGKQSMSAALYGTTGGRLVCRFDGYSTTSGRHEGIDFARGVGSPVHALVGGKVINIVRGANGRSGLSTIAVYDASTDKTVIYLHSAPSSNLRVGQKISRGHRIASEAWRGVSTSGSAHTHVEMRPGRHSLASKSVNDPVLDNPNPASFWRGQNYTIR
jgi:murein DD-endopeptidase MepM/ murein hydrolase activator NlpD